MGVMVLINECADSVMIQKTLLEPLNFLLSEQMVAPLLALGQLFLFSLRTVMTGLLWFAHLIVLMIPVIGPFLVQAFILALVLCALVTVWTTLGVVSLIFFATMGGMALSAALLWCGSISALWLIIRLLFGM